MYSFLYCNHILLESYNMKVFHIGFFNIHLNLLNVFYCLMAHFFLSLASAATYDSWPILSPINVYLGCF